MNKSSLLFLGALLLAPLAAHAQDASGYQVQESVSFARNSSKLSDAAQQKLRADMESLSVLMRYRPESSIEIAGYADPGEKKPGPLADARAQRVWEFLISQGLPAERMEPIGYGAQSRASSRVDIRITADDAVAMNQFAQPLPTPAPVAPAPTPAPSYQPPAVAVTPPVESPQVRVTPPVEMPPVATAPPPKTYTPTYTPPEASERYTPPPTAPKVEPAPELSTTPPPDHSWSTQQVKKPTAAEQRRIQAEEQRRIKAEQQEAARIAKQQADEQRRIEREAAAEQRRADQAAALERKQAAAEQRRAEQAAALERQQAAAELRKQQREEARLQAAQNAAEKKRMAEEAAMRVAMAQPPPTLTPEASDTTLKTSKGVKIIDNQTGTSYVNPPSAPTPKSALPGEGNYFIQGTAYFSANSRSLTPGSNATIDSLATRVQKLIQNKPNVRVDVVGHADPLTEGAQADVLAEGRAEELVKELAARGVDRSRLHAAGAADTQPLTSKKGDPARNLNMRAEIRVPI